MEQSTGYNFSASVPIVEGRVTCLKFAIPDAPDAQINAAPTVTRDFPSSNHHVPDVTMAGMPPSSTRHTGKQTSAHIAGGLAASPTPGPSAQACITRDNRYDISSGLQTPTMHQSEGTPSIRTCTDNSLGPPPRGHGLSPTVDTSDEFLIHRLHKEERKCQKTNTEKENGIEPPMLSYFEMDGKQSLSTPPPELSGHPKLQIGDLFCYHQAGRNDPALWIWSRVEGTHCDWQRVFAGFTRPVDGRMLAIVGSPKRPTWVTASWYRRRFLKPSLRD